MKVPAKDVRAKARVLALLSLASQHNELSFGTIQVQVLASIFAALCAYGMVPLPGGSLASALILQYSSREQPCFALAALAVLALQEGEVEALVVHASRRASWRDSFLSCLLPLCTGGASAGRGRGGGVVDQCERTGPAGRTQSPGCCLMSHAPCLPTGGAGAGGRRGGGVGDPREWAGPAGGAHRSATPARGRHAHSPAHLHVPALGRPHCAAGRLEGNLFLRLGSALVAESGVLSELRWRSCAPLQVLYLCMGCPCSGVRSLVMVFVRRNECCGATLQENVWTMKDIISSQTDTGLSRGLPAPKAVHAGV